MTIHTIHPYRHDGGWVFDDPAHDLVQEPLVYGTDEILDALAAEFANGADRLTIRFSDREFPGAQYDFQRHYEEAGGWHYTNTEEAWAGWLCPALGFYFDTPPDELWVEARP